jgi:site-specific DNA-methyltransferase (adenine-specific)
LMARRCRQVRWMTERVGPYEVNTVVCGDALELMRELPDGCVDAVVTDPPYGIPAGSVFWRNHGRSMEDWEGAAHNAEVPDWLQGVSFAEDAVCLEFGRNHPEAVEKMIARHRAAGLTPWHFVTLVKTSPAPTPRPKFATGFEMGMVSYKGKRQWFGNGYVVDRWIGQGMAHPSVERLHPTQKPLEPFRAWIAALAKPGGLVLDPFLGSGTAAVACVQTGRRFLGFDISPEYCEIARKRIRDAQAQPRLLDAEPQAMPSQAVLVEA